MYKSVGGSSDGCAHRWNDRSRVRQVTAWTDGDIHGLDRCLDRSIDKHVNA